MRLRYLSLFGATLLACTATACGGSTGDDPVDGNDDASADGAPYALPDGAIVTPAPGPDAHVGPDGALDPDASKPDPGPDAAPDPDAAGPGIDAGDAGHPQPDAAVADAAAGDASLDAGSLEDARAPADAATFDAHAPPDAAAPDAGKIADAAAPDASPIADAGAPDTSPIVDAAVGIDATLPDASIPDASVPDAADADVPCAIPSGAWTATVPAPALPPETAPLVDSVFNIELPASDLVYDPHTKLLYASVPSSFGANGNSIARIDPVTGTLVGLVYVGSEPHKLALSADGQFLYVGLDGARAVRRYTLATQTPDLQFPIADDNGYDVVASLRVLPHSPHSVLVGSGGGGQSGAAYVTVYDDGVARGAPLQQAASDVVATGSDALAFAPYWYSGVEALCIDKAGVHAVESITAPITDNSQSLDYPYVAGVLYSPSGRALDARSGTLDGTYATAGAVAVEPRVDRVFFLTSAWTSNSQVAEIVSYDLGHFTPAGSSIVAAAGAPTGNLVRWGRYGFAFTSGSYNTPAQISIVRSTLVPAGP